jgi:hypothetical protein
LNGGNTTIVARKSVMATVAAALLLVTFTSGGSAASIPAPLAKCSVDPIEVAVADGETAVEAKASALCKTALLPLLKVSLSAKVTGTKCAKLDAMIEPNPDPVPTWIKVRLKLACKPGEKGAVGAKFAVKMLGPNDVALAGYGFGDSFVDMDTTKTHGWQLTFVAGLGKLPPLSPDEQVFGSVGDEDDGSTQAQSDHEVY